jgi:hypothetical protein
MPNRPRARLAIQGIAAVLFLLALAGCDSSKGTLPTASGLAAGDDAALQKSVDSLVSQVSAIRDLSWKRPVKASWVVRDHLPKLLDSLDKALGYVGGGASSDEIFVALGYLDSSESLASSQSELVSNGVAAFYENGTDHLWVVTDQAKLSGLTSTIVHELVHALQDQNFKDSVPDTAELDEDEAFTFLEEGEAEYVATLWSMGSPTMDQYDLSIPDWTLKMVADHLDSWGYGSLPLLVSIPNLAPYSSGVSFVHRVHEQSGWSGVDGLHASHPRSTTQTLHPLTALHKDFLDWGDHQFESTADWESFGSGRLGEVYLTTLLYTQGNPATTGDAQGWNGDRFWIWRTRDSLHHAVVGRVSMDSATTAASFLRRWGEAFSQRIGKSTGLQGLDSFQVASANSESIVRGVRHGTELYLAYGDLHGSRLDSVWNELVSLHSTAIAAGRKLGTPREPDGSHWRGPKVHHPWPIQRSLIRL